MRVKHSKLEAQKKKSEEDVIALTLDMMCERTANFIEKERTKAWSTVNRATMDTMAMRLTKGVRKNIEL